MTIQPFQHQNRALAQAGALLDQVNVDAQARLFQEIFTIGCQVGGVINTLQSQKMVLESGNRTLENDIRQVKLSHALELNAAVDSWSVKTKSVVQKLQTIVEKINAYSSKVKEGYCGSSTIDTSSLQTLISSIPKLTDENLRKYPEYRTDQVIPQEKKEEATFIPSWNAFVITQTDSTIQGLIQSRKQEIESLEEEVKLLRATQFADIDKKKSMIDFHGPFLKEFNAKMENELGLRTVFETARTIIEKVKWDIPLTSSRGCSNCVCSPTSLNDRHKEIYHRAEQDNYTRRLKKLHEKVTGILSSIEECIDPGLFSKVNSFK